MPLLLQNKKKAEDRKKMSPKNYENDAVKNEGTVPLGTPLRKSDSKRSKKRGGMTRVKEVWRQPE